MKFIVDAQLPNGIAWILNNRGFVPFIRTTYPTKKERAISKSEKYLFAKVEL